MLRLDWWSIQSLPLKQWWLLEIWKNIYKNAIDFWLAKKWIIFITRIYHKCFSKCPWHFVRYMNTTCLKTCRPYIMIKALINNTDGTFTYIRPTSQIIRTNIVKKIIEKISLLRWVFCRPVGAISVWRYNWSIGLYQNDLFCEFSSHFNRLTIRYWPKINVHSSRTEWSFNRWHHTLSPRSIIMICLNITVEVIKQMSIRLAQHWSRTGTTSCVYVAVHIFPQLGQQTREVEQMSFQC